MSISHYLERNFDCYSEAASFRLADLEAMTRSVDLLQPRARI
jgi:hypothetical protein